MSTKKLCPSVSLKATTIVEERLEKKMNDMDSFNNSIHSPTEMITYFEDGNGKSETNKKLYSFTLNIEYSLYFWYYY